jgi:RNA polymerase sigma-70 factor (ECF subfamily)
MPETNLPDSGVDASDLTARLKEWVNELPERQREALMLSRFQGLSHREIADIMAISPRTVNNHIMRALHYLQNQILAFEPTLLET